MPSGWDVYYIVILAGVLALGIPATLAILSMLLSTSSTGKSTGSSKGRGLSFRFGKGRANPAVGQSLGQRTNTRFFLAINVSLVLIALMLALIPCIAVIQPGAHPGLVARTLAVIVTFASIAALVLFHAAKKSDLSWLRTFLKDR